MVEVRSPSTKGRNSYIKDANTPSLLLFPLPWGFFSHTRSEAKKQKWWNMLLPSLCHPGQPHQRSPPLPRPLRPDILPSLTNSNALEWTPGIPSATGEGWRSNEVNKYWLRIKSNTQLPASAAAAISLRCWLKPSAHSTAAINREPHSLTGCVQAPSDSFCWCAPHREWLNFRSTGVQTVGEKQDPESGLFGYQYTWQGTEGV